jgi:hypothetical protein
MAKTWDKMNDSEKLEELRDDIAKIYSAVNQTNRDLRALSHHVGEIGDAVKKLEGWGAPASKRKAKSGNKK